MTYISGNLEDDIKNKVRLICRMKGITLSKFVRNSVDDRLEKEIDQIGEDKFELIVRDLFGMEDDIKHNKYDRDYNSGHSGRRSDRPSLYSLSNQINDGLNCRRAGRCYDNNIFGNARDIADL